MTLDQLKYAVEVQNWKNFSRAAEACNITQPSLSVQIAKLEEELDVTLFDRSRSKVEVTEYGEELLKQARVILAEAARMSQLANDLKGEVRGHFRLGIIPTLAPFLLPNFIGEFGRAFPSVELSVYEEPTERLIQQIDQGTLDGAILSTPAKCPESLVEKVLFYEPFVVFASTGHRILDNKKVTIEQISSGEILLLDETHCLRDQVLQLCRTRHKVTGQKLRIQSGSLQTLIEIIRHEEGFTLLPELAVKQLTATEQTRNIRSLEKPVPARKVSLVFNKARLKRSIIDALKDKISQGLPDGVFLTTSGRDFRVVSPAIEYFEL